MLFAETEPTFLYQPYTKQIKNNEKELFKEKRIEQKA